MNTFRIAILTALLVSVLACGDDAAGKKGNNSAVNINQDTGPNVAANSGNVASNSGNVAANSGNVASNSGTNNSGPVCGYAQAEYDGVCRLQDHFWFSIGPSVYEGRSEFEQTTVVGCNNIAVRDSLSPATPDLEVGNCSLYIREGTPEPPPTALERGPLDLGEFTVSLGGEMVPLQQDDAFCYRPVENIDVARAGEPVVVAASGGSDIAGFEQATTLPAMPRFDPQAFIDATGAITLQPQGTTATDEHSLIWFARADTTDFTTICSFESGAPVTIPADIISEVRGTGAEDLSLGITRFENVRIDSSVGDAHVNGSFTATYAFTF